MKGALDNSRDLIVLDRARAARPGFIRQTLNAFLHKPPAPLADRVLMEIQTSRNLFACQSLGTYKDYPAAIRQRTGDLPAAHLTFNVQWFDSPLRSSDDAVLLGLRLRTDF